MPFVSFVLRQLIEPGRTMSGYIFRAWLVQIIGAFAFAALGFFLNTGIGDPREIADPDLVGGPLTQGEVYVLIFLLVVATPVIETAMLWGGVILIRRFVTRDVLRVAIVSAVVWGLAHAILNNVPNGVSAMWSFFCFTIAFQVGELSSKQKAFLVPAVMHAMTNTISSLAIVAGIQGS